MAGEKYMLLKNNSENGKQQTYFFQPSSVVASQTATGTTSATPVEILEPLQIAINNSANTQGVLQSLSVNKPHAFSTATDINNNSLTLNNHGLIQGQQIEWYPGPYTATGNSLLIGGGTVASGQPFYAIVVDSNTIQLAESPEAAASGTSLTITSPTLPSDISYSPDSQILNTTTGVFTIENHGLTNNLPLVYRVPTGVS